MTKLDELFKILEEECECGEEMDDDVICSECGEHSASCPNCGSVCCGSKSHDSDPDVDMER